MLKCFRPFNGDPIGVIQGLEFLETVDASNTHEAIIAVPQRSETSDIGIQIDIDGAPHVATAFDLAKGTEIAHRERGLAFDIADQHVGEPIFERMGRAAGIMHRAAAEYPLWWAEATPGIDPASSGKGRSFCFHDWIAMTERSMRLAPELEPHWAELRKRIDAIPINRKTFGFAHFDYGFTNMLYDGRSLTVIDHDALFGFYLVNLEWKAEGKSSYDYPMMETRRSEMLENKPTIDFDLSLS